MALITLLPAKEANGLIIGLPPSALRAQIIPERNVILSCRLNSLIYLFGRIFPEPLPFLELPKLRRSASVQICELRTQWCSSLSQNIVEQRCFDLHSIRGLPAHLLGYEQFVAFEGQEWFCAKDFRSSLKS